MCLYLIPPMVMVYLGESGRAGNRHLESECRNSDAHFFVSVPYHAAGFFLTAPRVRVRLGAEPAAWTHVASPWSQNRTWDGDLDGSFPPAFASLNMGRRP